MKTIVHHLIPALGLAMALPVFAADTDTKPADPKKDPKAHAELRVITTTDNPATRRIGVRRIGEPGEMESVTFLGVETGPVSPTLASQLGLSDGSGLVVNHVSPKTPAAEALKQHDILLKLDDQILIEQRQLSVLIRGHKEGDEVTLTYLRGGKQATAKVKLMKHDVPKMAIRLDGAGLGGLAGLVAPGQNFAYAFGQGGGGDGQGGPGEVVTNPDDVNRVLALIDAAHASGGQRMNFSSSIGSGEGSINMSVNTGNSHITSNDERGLLELTITEGKKTLVAKSPKGDEIFSGPVNTPEERKTLPDEVRERLEKLEGMKQFSFKAGADFQGTDTKFMRVPAEGISLPRQPAPARRPGVVF